jgi:hypothetical protein
MQPLDFAAAPMENESSLARFHAVALTPVTGNEHFMTQTQHEYKTLSFNCSAVARVIKIDREYKIRVTRSGEELGRIISKTDCSDKDNCLIATRHGMGTSYDWSKCVFLHPPQA